MIEIKLHLTNGDSPAFSVESPETVDDIRDEIDAGKWLNFGNKRFVRGGSVVWIEIVDTQGSA